MRISISTQGGSFFFRGVDYTAQFAERANKYIKSEQKVVDSFKAVKQSVYRMNGGSGYSPVQSKNSIRGSLSKKKSFRTLRTL